MNRDEADDKARTEALDPVIPKPRPDEFQPAVGWLLGSQLFGSLKRILLQTIYSDRLDHRDWMRGSIIDRSAQVVGARDDEEYWFDYIADSGDCQRATYSIACLCLSDLYAVGAEISLDDVEGATKLPRGDFLFVGGDTAYPVADLPTLQRRFREPFQWASRDVAAKTDGHIDQRLLLGIPGNHDYYDALDGFNRQIRAAPMPETQQVSARARESADGKPMLQIDAFYRAQEASYVAIRLPFDWWFLGLDTAGKQLDFRQVQFFKRLLDAGGSNVHTKSIGPTKLIVATPNPTTAFGQKAGDELAAPFTQLKLKAHFVDAAEQKPLELGPDECRLDISGNFHHYERYWGETLTPFELPKQGRQTITGYASVVAGGGSAFLHPTHVRLGPVESERRYPEPRVSQRLIADRILDPRNVYRGGFVSAVSFWVSFLICLASFEQDRVLPLGRGWHASNSWRSPTTMWPSVYGTLSVLVAALLLWAGGSWARRVSARNARWSRSAYAWLEAAWFLPSFVLAGLALCLPAVVIDALPGARMLDITAFLVVLLLGAGLGAGAFAQGAAGRGPLWKVFFVVMGLWHAVLQTCTGTILARCLSYPSLLAIAISVPLFSLGGSRLLRRPTVAPSAALLVFWLGLCAIVIGSAGYYRADALASLHPQLSHPWVVALFAGVLGIVFTGVWLGWYLAVSVALGGHQNEAGVVARVDSHKQMIRFRLTKSSITGYVVAVDSPSTDLGQLAPRLVDVFRVGTSAQPSER